MQGEKKVFPLPTFRVYSPEDLSKKWFVYWYEGRKRRKKYGEINQHATPEARLKAARQLINQIKSEITRRVSKTEDTLQGYMQAHASRWRQRTMEQYQSVVAVLLGYLAGRELTQALLEAFLESILASRHPTTYNKYIAILSRIFRGAGLYFDFQGIEKAKAQATPARYFQRHQAKLLLRRIDEADPELGLFVRFLYYCFIRPKELRMLRVGDVLLEEGEIRVPGEVSKNTKTQFVVIPAAFLPCLNFLYENKPGDFIFPSPADASKPVSKNNMYRRHKAILDELNFGDGYTLYSWKHTGAVMAAKAGISIKELQLQLRHHSLDETDKYLRQMGVKDLGRLRENFPGI